LRAACDNLPFGLQQVFATLTVLRMNSPRGALRAAALFALLAASPAHAAGAAALPWWGWPIALFAVTFVIGILAVLAGVGGGVLFVPIVGGLFPFHLDFVRATGLLLALSGAMSAAPRLLRSGMASLRLAMPLALVASLGSISGALLGFALPARLIEGSLGATIIGIALLIWKAKSALYPRDHAPDRLGAALGLHGRYVDSIEKREVSWRVHRSAIGIGLSALTGLLGGMFGLGAGWATVPMLNLLLGVPLKVAVATAVLWISIANSAAAWIYLLKGAVLPMVALPSIVGVMAGARVGAHLLGRLPAHAIRRLVIVLLVVAGLRALLAGLGVWK
jgi:uncharacterized membrane protein YfcA